MSNVHFLRPAAFWLGWCVVLAISSLIAVALAFLAPGMAAVKEGTSEEFWDCACELKPLENPLRVRGRIYGPMDGWFFYEVSGRGDGISIHGTELFRVREAEVAASFDGVLARLENAPPDMKVRERIRAGLARWRSRADGPEKNAAAFVTDLQKAREAELKIVNPELFAYDRQSAEDFEQRRIRLRWRWAAFLFEWVFLSALVLFMAWPAIRGLGWRRYALHFGAIPLLFIAPAYLGYATYSFTSAGPTGGILYPHLLILLHGGSCNAVDREILLRVPPILEVISTRIYSPAAISGSGMPGPTTMIAAGTLIAASVYVVHLARQALGRRNAATVNRPVASGMTPS